MYPASKIKQKVQEFLVNVCVVRLMKKIFFLKYISSLEISKVVKILEEEFALSFEEHDSDYFGIYFKYTGESCDKIMIRNNLYQDGESHFDNANINSIVEFSFITGKNKDKEKKYQFIKTKMELYETIFIPIT